MAYNTAHVAAFLHHLTPFTADVSNADGELRPQPSVNIQQLHMRPADKQCSLSDRFYAEIIFPCPSLYYLTVKNGKMEDQRGKVWGTGDGCEREPDRFAWLCFGKKNTKTV